MSQLMQLNFDNQFKALFTNNCSEQGTKLPVIKTPLKIVYTSVDGDGTN